MCLEHLNYIWGYMLILWDCIDQPHRPKMQLHNMWLHRIYMWLSGAHKLLNPWSRFIILCTHLHRRLCDSHKIMWHSCLSDDGIQMSHWIGKSTSQKCSTQPQELDFLVYQVNKLYRIVVEAGCITCANHTLSSLNFLK